MKTVILTEKPSVAKDIASVLNVKTKQNGYFENEIYQITWAFGHLVQLATPDYYDEKYKKWTLKDLPIFPSKFKLVLKNDSGAKKQYHIIKKLFFNASTIINATDAGREGELIFRYIYNLSGSKKPIKRLWISSMTNESIKKGFENLKEGNEYNNLYAAAYARSISDWVIGLNITRAFTIANKSSKVLSLGRVQTPTLYMIIKRFLENKNFKASNYYIPQIELHYNSIDFIANYKTDSFLSEEQANKIINSIKNEILHLEEIKDQEKEVKPPFLLDLTTLQQVCNKNYGYSAQSTLNTLQNLYEKHKIVSYPRTDSRYLTDDMASTVKKTLKNITSSFSGVIAEIYNRIFVDVTNKRIFNNSKVSDHHAIIPTDISNIRNIYNNLNLEEKNIFNTVVDYFIKAFLPNYKYRSLSYYFKIKDYLFIASGNTPIKKGWKINLFTNSKNEFKKENNTVLQNLPELPSDFKTNNFKSQNIKKTTTAPPLLNEATLLKYMDNIHTFFKSENLENIKKSGIGTPATRAATIETLKKREYIILKGKYLLPTELGLLVFNKIKDEPISSPTTTSKMESYLDNILLGKTNMDEVILKIKKFTEIIINNIISNADKSSFDSLTNKSNELEETCPKCKTGTIIIGKKSYYCSNYNSKNDKCDFTIWNIIAGKKITARIVKMLINKRITKDIKGFKSKKGNSFSAQLKLTDDFKINFEFKNKKFNK